MGGICNSIKPQRSIANAPIQNQYASPQRQQPEEYKNIENNPQLQVATEDVKKDNKPMMKSRLQHNENCFIKNQENLNIVRKIGEVKGEQVIIASCKNSTIIILDYSASVIIDSCVNCNIFIAPCNSR